MEPPRNGYSSGVVHADEASSGTVSKFNKEAVLNGLDEIFLVTGARYRLHLPVSSIFDEALVDMNADDLTEGNEARGGVPYPPTAGVIAYPNSWAQRRRQRYGF